MPSNIWNKSSSKHIKGLTHYLGDKQDFDVSSYGPLSGISRVKNNFR